MADFDHNPSHERFLYIMKKWIKQLGACGISCMVFHFSEIHLAITAYINSSFYGKDCRTDANRYTVYYSCSLWHSNSFYMPKFWKKSAPALPPWYETCVHILSILAYSLWHTFCYSTSICALPLYPTLLSSTLQTFSCKHETDQKDVGGIRGTYLTKPTLLGSCLPLVAGAILARCGVQHVYIIGLVAMLPVFFLLILCLLDISKT